MSELIDTGVICNKSNGITKCNIPHSIIRHSPDGFNFGYGGSGPSELALNILFYFTKDQEFSSKYYQEFKQLFIEDEKSNHLYIPWEEVKTYVNARKNREHRE